MRLLGWDERRGTAVLLPEDIDDLWSLYVLVEPGDLVRARTSREKRPEGARRGRRRSVTLTIRVEKKAFDALMGRLRLLGVIVEAPAEFEDDVGKHHALSVKPGSALSLQKAQWGRYHLEVLKRACAPRPKPLLVLCLDDEDFCVALVGTREVEVLAEGENTIARSEAAVSREAILRPFFREALRALRDAWESQGKPIAILGPALERDLFLSLLRSEEPELAKRIVAVRGVSTGGLPGIYEALRAGVLARALSEARLVREAEAVRELLARLGKGDDRVAYGLEEVRKACEYGAVEKLLISDALLREADEIARRELEELMMDVEAKGGQVMIIGSRHEAGRNLLALGGVAALLRFPIS